MSEIRGWRRAAVGTATVTEVVGNKARGLFGRVQGGRRPRKEASGRRQARTPNTGVVRPTSERFTRERAV